MIKTYKILENNLDLFNQKDQRRRSSKNVVETQYNFTEQYAIAFSKPLRIFPKYL